MRVNFRYIIITIFLFLLFFISINIFAEESNNEDINKKEFQIFKPKEEILKDKNISFPRDI